MFSSFLDFAPYFQTPIELHMLQVKLNQQWRNLPIYGTALVLEQEPDANLILESADGEFLSGVEDDIASETPTLSKDEALEFALLYNQDQGKPIQNVSPEALWNKH